MTVTKIPAAAHATRSWDLENAVWNLAGFLYRDFRNPLAAIWAVSKFLMIVWLIFSMNILIFSESVYENDYRDLDSD